MSAFGRLPLVEYPSGYILKPQTDEYRAVPEAEHLVMMMAKEVGIRTVPFGPIETGSDRFSPAFITRRIDRTFSKKKKTEKLAMEDFCQLDGRLTQDKYHGSYIILSDDHEQFALTMNGKKRNLHRKDFLIYADRSGIPAKTAENMLRKVLAKKAALVKMCSDSLLPEDMRAEMTALMEKRFGELG